MINCEGADQYSNLSEKYSVNSNEFAAVVLAAGLSRRMGEHNKMLMLFDGKSLLQRCLSSVINAGISEVVVVLGYQHLSVENELSGYDVLYVVNPKYEQGQGTSVQCGLNALSGYKKASLICLADQPLVDAQHLIQLMAAFESRSEAKEIVVPVYNAKRGNPVVISEPVRQEVKKKYGSSGCRKYIDEHPWLVEWASFDDAAYTQDIDTPEEYNKLLASITKKR